MYIGQRCIELSPSTEGSEVTNCTSGVPGVGYQGDTCVIVYSNTMGRLYQLRSCQENTGWTIISGDYVNLTYIHIRIHIHDCIYGLRQVGINHMATDSNQKCAFLLNNSILF